MSVDSEPTKEGLQQKNQTRVEKFFTDSGLFLNRLMGISGISAALVLLFWGFKVLGSIPFDPDDPAEFLAKAILCTILAFYMIWAGKELWKLGHKSE